MFEFIVYVNIATAPPYAKCISMVFMDNKVIIIIIVDYRTLADRILVQLASAHLLASNITELKARVGRFL